MTIIKVIIYCFDPKLEIRFEKCRNRGTICKTKIKLMQTLLSILVGFRDLDYINAQTHQSIDAFKILCWCRMLWKSCTEYRTNVFIVNKFNIKRRLSLLCVHNALVFYFVIQFNSKWESQGMCLLCFIL